MRRTCIHFDGAGPGKICRAGVRVERVRDEELRLPCHQLTPPGDASAEPVTGRVRCDELEWPPAAPAAMPMQGFMLAALQDLQGNICPRCKEPIRGQVEINGRICAMPCRHVLRGAEKEPR